MGVLAGAVASTGLTAASGRQSNAGGGKPQFQADPANTGYAPDECPPTANLTQEWEIETLSRTQIRLAAAGDSIYGLGENTGVVEDVALDSGSIRWRRELDDRLEDPEDGLTAPGFVDGTLYLGAGETWDDGRDVPHGVVYALDAAVGSTRWSIGVGRGPAYVTPDDDAVYAGSVGALYALDPASGSALWHDVPADSDAAIEFPAVADGTVYYATDNGRAYALDAADGDRQWSTDAGAGTPPSVADGRVYVGEGDGPTVRALDASDGSEAWTFDAPGDVTHPPVLADGRAFVFVRRPSSDRYDDGVLTALDAATGQQLWQFETPAVYSGPLPPLVAGDSVMVVGNPEDSDYDNAAYVVDASSGTREARVEMSPDPGTAAPVVLDDTLVLGHDSAGQGFLTAYAGDTDCGVDCDHTVTVAANGPTEYALAVDGCLEPDLGDDRLAAEPSDEPTRRSDGTWMVSDLTGPAPSNADGETYYGDRFRFGGSITSVEVQPRDGDTTVRITIDGEEVSSATAQGFGG